MRLRLQLRLRLRSISKSLLVAALALSLQLVLQAGHASAYSLSLTPSPAASVPVGGTLSLQCSYLPDTPSSSVSGYYMQLLLRGQFCAATGCSQFGTQCSTANNTASFQCNSAYSATSGVYSLSVSFTNVGFQLTNSTLVCVVGAYSSNLATTFIYGSPTVTSSFTPQATILAAQSAAAVCSVTSSTVVNTNAVTWKLNGLTYTPDGVRVTSSVQTLPLFPYSYLATLNFTSALVADSGAYSCVAGNTYGSTTGAGTSFTVASLPASVRFSFGNTPAPVAVVNGNNVYNELQSVALVCSVDGGSPASSVAFYRRVATATNGDNDALVLSPYTFSRSDNAYVFLCRATNAATQLTYSATGGYAASPTVGVLVYFAPSGTPLLTLTPQVLQVSEGSASSLTCSSTGSSLPAASLGWSVYDAAGRLSGTPSSSAVTQQQTATGYGFQVSSSVTLGSGDTTRGSNGYVYVCSMQYSAASVGQSNVTLNVSFAPSSISATSSPTSLFTAMQYGSAVQLNCSAAASNPPTTVQWSYTKSPGAAAVYGQPNFPSYATVQTSSVASSFNAVSTTSLVSFAAQPADNGAYYACTFYQGSAQIANRQFSTLTILYPPQVTIQPSSSSALVAGQSLSLTCIITDNGNPAYNFATNVLSYAWYRTSSLNAQNNNLSYFTSLNYAANSFSFSTLQYADTGYYVCTVATPIGVIQSTSFTVNMSYPPMINPSTAAQSTFYSTVGAAALISFSIISYPLPTAYQWYFVNPQTLVSSPISNGAQYFAYQTNWQSFALSVTNVQQSSFGTYTCLLSQAVQNQQFIFQLVQSGGNTSLPTTSSESASQATMSTNSLVIIICACVGGAIVVTLSVAIPVVIVRNRERVKKREALEAALSSGSQFNGAQSGVGGGGGHTSVGGVADYSMMVPTDMSVQNDDGTSLAFSSVSQPGKSAARQLSGFGSQNSVNHSGAGGSRERLPGPGPRLTPTPTPVATAYDRHNGSRPIRPNTRLVSTSITDLANDPAHRPIHNRLSKSTGLDNHVGGILAANSVRDLSASMNLNSSALAKVAPDTRNRSTSQNSLDSQRSKHTTTTTPTLHISNAPPPMYAPPPAASIASPLSVSAGNLSVPEARVSRSVSYVNKSRAEEMRRSKLGPRPRGMSTDTDTSEPREVQSRMPPPLSLPPPDMVNRQFSDGSFNQQNDSLNRYHSAGSSGYSSNANQDGSLPKQRTDNNYPRFAHQNGQPQDYYGVHSSNYNYADYNMDYV